MHSIVKYLVRRDVKAIDHYLVNSAGFYRRGDWRGVCHEASRLFFKIENGAVYDEQLQENGADVVHLARDLETLYLTSMEEKLTKSKIKKPYQDSRVHAPRVRRKLIDFLNQS